jgi:hypothetical protein
MPPRGPGVPGWVVVTFIALTGVCVVGGTAVLQSATWFVEETLHTLEIDFPAVVWPLIAVANAVLAGVVLVPAALIIKRPKLRAVARTWAVAAGCLAVLGLVRAAPATETLYSTPALILVAFGLAAVIAVSVRRSDPAPVRTRGLLGATAAGLALLLPWLWLGALGSVTDTLLALGAAASLGLLGGVLLSRLLWPAFAADPLGRWAHTAVAGLAAGTALALVAAGSGASGTQLGLLLTVPPVAFALAALAHPDGLRWPAGAVLIGLAAVGPFAFGDPEELSILLGFADIGRWVLVAAVAGLLVAIVAGLVAAATGRIVKPGSTISPVGARSLLAAGLAVVLAVAGTTVYAAAGQPGFHGERLFVILDSQADLSGLDAVANIDDRRRRTYRRLVEHADRTQRDLRRDLSGRDVEFTPYYLVNAVEVPDNPINRAWLAARDDVGRVLASPRLRPLPFDQPVERGNETEPPERPEWNLTNIGAPSVWRDLQIDGTGIVVGESDSGVDGRHPALRDNYRGRTSGDDYNWYDPWNDSRSPVDIGGHGTHTTGTAVGGKNIGVAPGAEWIGCVNLARNFANPALYLDCLQFMLAPFPRGGDPLRDGDPSRAADVLNNSWGCPELEGCDPESLRPAAQALRAAGIFAVVSAGNTGDAGCGTVRDPLALYPEVLTVGSVDRRGRVSSFSSRGPVTADGSDRDKPDVVAPGEEVLSAMPGGTYAKNDGTSMAGPHVAGVVALMWQANPELVGDIDRTADLLRTTAKPADPALSPDQDDCGGDANITGAGIVDALAAVKAARQ